MKIKNLKVFVASILVFTLIGTVNLYRDSKLNNKFNKNKFIKNDIENIKFKDIFSPVEDYKIDIKPIVTYKKTNK